MEKNRVVITGLGIICAIGNNIPEFLDGLKKNKTGIRNINRFDASKFRSNSAAIIENNLFNKNKKENDYCLDLIVESAAQSLKDSKIDLDKIDLSRAGISMATSLGCVENLEFYLKEKMMGNFVSTQQLKFVPHCIPGSILASKYHFRGPLLSIDTACASGSNSLGYAYDQIQNNTCDVMLAGGVDIISPLSLSGFSGLMNITKNVCRPFDNNRDGLILGEGSGIVILESLSHAENRNAHIYAEVLGYGLSNDAYHDTQPDPDGEGASRSIYMALENAGISPKDVNYINAHGTGTKFNDKMEAKAILKVFNENIENLYVSSIKAAVGHTLGAAGAVEFIATVLSIKNKFIPPTLNFETPLVGFEKIDFVPNNSRECDINIAISNSFGFAGNCCSIAVGSFKN